MEFILLLVFFLDNRTRFGFFLFLYEIESQQSCSVKQMSLRIVIQNYGFVVLLVALLNLAFKLAVNISAR